MMSSAKIICALGVSIPLALAGCGGGHEDTVESDLVCLKRSDLRLVTAALNRDLRGMQSALQEGADANASIEGLDPPIVIAAVTDDADAVKLLLDKGANVNARDGERSTALISACFNNNNDIVQLLLAKGADANLSAYPVVNGTKVRFTALMIAKSKGNAEIVKSLTEAGAKE